MIDQRNEYLPGTTWRTTRLTARDHARVTYQPIDPWNPTKRLERPYHVFINGTAQMSYVSLEAAHEPSTTAPQRPV